MVFTKNDCGDSSMVTCVNHFHFNNFFFGSLFFKGGVVNIFKVDEGNCGFFRRADKRVAHSS